MFNPARVEPNVQPLFSVVHMEAASFLGWQ